MPPTPPTTDPANPERTETAMDETETSTGSTATQSTTGPGAQQGDQPEMIHKRSSTSTFTKTYTKTFWHYVSNNPDRRGIHHYINTQGLPSINVDFGGQYIPYDNCRTSMRPSDWLDGWRNASAFRILKHSVKISEIQPIQESVNGVTAKVQSQFINNPSLWIYTDPLYHGLLFFGFVEVFGILFLMWPLFHVLYLSG